MNLLQRFMAVTTIAGTVAFSASANAGIVWNEIGAGDLLGSAEVTVDSTHSALDLITGRLGSFVPVDPGNPVYEVDLYKIYIDAPSSFSASSTSSAADTALFLFNDAGFGVYMNDDTSLDLLAVLPAGVAGSPSLQGLYYLGIALGGYLPFDNVPFEVFALGSFTDVLAGNPAAGPLAVWGNTLEAGSEAEYSYEIALTGARVAELPEPGTLALVLLAGLAGALRSRRVN